MPEEKSLSGILWDFFCSLRLTIFTLIALAVTSIIGTIRGFKAFVKIVEGALSDEVRPRDGDPPIKLGFTVRVDDFVVRT